MELVKHSLSAVSLEHIKPLFATRTLAINTSITVALWGLIGLAYPLFNGIVLVRHHEIISNAYIAGFITLYLEARTSGGNGSIKVS